jgi:hypothetical protein
MIKSVVAVAALSGGLALGTAGMAGASGTHTSNCTKAEARVPKINAREAKLATWVTAAQGRESKAVAAGHPKVAARIGHRITRAQMVEARGEKVLSRIAADCGGSSTSSSSSTSAS